MKSDFYWQLFLSTGAPEAYLMFTKERKTEREHVFEHNRTGSSGNSIQ